MSFYGAQFLSSDYSEPTKWFREFAYKPIKTVDGWIWFREYYRCQIYLNAGKYQNTYHTTEEYLVMKLSEKFNV